MNLTQALGWTLIHFVWQGAAVAVVLACALALLRRSNPSVRYAASCAAMVLMLICAIATFVGLQAGAHSPSAMPIVVARAFRNSAAPAVLSAVLPAHATVTDYLPLFVWAWFGGVIALSFRSLGGWVVASRFARRQTRPAGALWEERFAALVKRLRISRPVTLAVSSVARVPAMVGCFKPIVLLPAAALSGLTVEQIEGLLAHELAHVRRHDYMINLLQTGVETLLFYHPAVWWVSRSIRNERENCCDDMAVQICGNPATYVRALADLAQLCGGTPAFAMAANRGSLLDRVERLLRLNPHGSSAPSGLLAVIGITLVCVSVIGVEARGFARRQKAASPAIAQTEAPAGPEAQTLPKLDNLVEDRVSRPQAGGLLGDKTTSPPPGNSDQKQEDWLDQIEAAGFKGLSADKLIEAKTQGVDDNYIREIRAAGFDPDINKLIEAKIQGIDVNYIREIRAAGFDPDLDQLIEAKIQGINAAYIREMRSTGFQFTLDKLVEVRVQEVTTRYIQEVRALGYPDISLDKILEMKTQGVTSYFVRAAKSRFKDLTLDQIIQLKIYNILK